ncbi:hypothetical protein [Brevundimonas lenta]|uniref:TonB C-terminal domain-containing protein n=1 Tax=Brevundimonas lenta TaxID=424796 RepID=A0A7W6JBD2_9CAUL|nr:hypothetical protein [Brevundimonas lenta]MBB4082000.1 hypothetical protein [Brevundimonas lenta]
MKKIIVALCISAVALPALAQDTGDWSLYRNHREKLVMAYTLFDNGLSLTTRCVDGGFEAIVGGLPEPTDADAPTRTIGLAFGDAPMSMQNWNVAINRAMAVSERPAPLARQMRQGGRLQVLVPNGAGPGRNLRYDVTLPASTTAIDDTLFACRRPLTDPRDAQLAALPDGGLPAGLTWVRTPVVEYPSTRYARGFAVVSCLTNPDGRLRDCAVESEHPVKGGFGEAARRAVVGSRVRRGDGSTGPIPQVMVTFRANFVTEGYETRSERDASRDQDRRTREESRNAREADGG